MSVRVKICGITNPDDAWVALEAGADALGFVFCASSPRCVSVPVAARIVRQLPPFVAKVGLFVNAAVGHIQSVAEECGLDTLQLHGDEPPEFCQQFRLKVIKAFRVRDQSSLKRLSDYEPDAWLLDSFVPGQSGGTGQGFDWELARRARQWCSRLILAGGLNAGNVADAVRQVRPYAVDVSSGVESKPGRKDPIKVREFIRAAKTADLP